MTPLPEQPKQDSGSTQRVIGWVGIGVSVLASGAAIYLGLESLAARDRFKADRNNVEKREDAAQMILMTNVAWGTAAVTGIGGTVLLLTAPTIEF